MPQRNDFSIALRNKPVWRAAAVLALALGLVGFGLVAAAPPPSELTVTCNGPVEGFDSGIPVTWTVINNAPGNPVVWTNVVGSGEAGNYTGGAGDGASASSDLQGGGSGLYDTELRTPAIDLTGFTTAAVSYEANYQNFALVDFLNLDVSTNGGASWTTVLSWNEDHGSFRITPGEVVSVDLTAYAGQPNVLLRWHYFDPNGPDTSQDWYAQVDNIALSCGFPAVDLDKTVGTDPNICAVTDVLEISAPSDVTYCYKVTNTGNMTLTTHDLVDSELGTILSGFNFALAPGATVFLTQTATINVTTVNTATWTVANPSIPAAVASDTASATVLKIVDIHLPAVPKLSSP